MLEASTSNQWTPLGLIMARLEPVHVCAAAQVPTRAKRTVKPTAQVNFNAALFVVRHAAS